MSDEFSPIANTIFSSFEMSGALPQAVDDSERFRQLRTLLIGRIEELLKTDAEKLKWILYRIDVSESKVYEALAANERLHYAEALANLIIERQIEKAKSRAKYSDGPADWSFDV